MPEPHPIANDMVTLSGILSDHVAPLLHLPTQEDFRILNLACGQCDEAETLVNFAKSQTRGDVELIGADIRIREILQAREEHSNLPAKFLLEDATKLDQHQSLGHDFKMVMMRHQNYWHGPDLWKKIFEQGLSRVDENGLFVITSYFDKEHQLALDAIQDLGAELVISHSNQDARQLMTPGKYVDKHLAVFRKIKM